MIVAIPEHKGRVAPVFDCCAHILVFLLTGHEEELLADENWSDQPRFTRARRLRDLMVELVVCGGISWCLEEQVRHQGIRLIPWVAGELYDVLGAMRKGKIFDQCYSMPGRIGCRRDRFHRRFRPSALCQGYHGKEHHHAGIR